MEKNVARELRMAVFTEHKSTNYNTVKPSSFKNNKYRT